MILQSPLGKSILVGVAVTLAGAVFSLLFPNVQNYLLLPGIMIVFALSGGVHGYSTGVYLPSLPVWYALGGVINVVIYSVVIFLILQRLHREKNTRSL
jgi:hypothetical protein